MMKCVMCSLLEFTKEDEFQICDSCFSMIADFACAKELEEENPFSVN